MAYHYAVKKGQGDLGLIVFSSVLGKKTENGQINAY